MFEQPQRKSALWRILPLAALIFVAIVAIVLLLSRAGKVDSEALTGVLHRGDPDFDWYKKYVELVDPRLNMGGNFAGGRIVMCSGTIDNGGERTIDVVEIKISLFNYDVLIYDTIRTPIRPGPYTPPIESLTKRSFTFYLEDIPEGWMRSHAEMSISGLRFVERQPLLPAP